MTSKFTNLDASGCVNDALTLKGKLGTTKGTGATTDVGFEVLSAWNQGGLLALTSDGIFVLNVPGGDKFVRAGGGIGGWGGRSSSTRQGELTARSTASTSSTSTPFPIQFGVRSASHQRSLDRLGMTLAKGADNEAQIPDSAIGNYPSNWYGNLPVNPRRAFAVQDQQRLRGIVGSAVRHLHHPGRAAELRHQGRHPPPT